MMGFCDCGQIGVFSHPKKIKSMIDKNGRSYFKWGKRRFWLCCKCEEKAKERAVEMEAFFNMDKHLEAYRHPG